MNFLNPPIEKSKEAYQEVLDTITSRYKDAQGLVAIHDWGDASVPGISDIDILLTFSEKKSGPLPFLKRSFRSLPKGMRYLVCHPFVFITESGFRNLPWIYPDGNHRLVYGKRIDKSKLRIEDIKKARMALMNDLIIRHYPRDFLPMSLSGKIPTRSALLRLNSLTYTIKNLKNITGKPMPEEEDFSEEVSKLRSSWFERGQNQRESELSGLIERAPGAMLSVIETFSDFLDSQGLVSKKGSKRLLYEDHKNRTIFIEGWERKDALKRMSREFKRKGRFSSILPANLSSPLGAYTSSDGPIGRYIRSRLEGRAYQAPSLDYVFKKRIELFDSQARLSERLRHSDFSAFFDYGHDVRSGINNKAARILRALRR